MRFFSPFAFLKHPINAGCSYQSRYGAHLCIQGKNLFTGPDLQPRVRLHRCRRHRRRDLSAGAGGVNIWWKVKPICSSAFEFDTVYFFFRCSRVPFRRVLKEDGCPFWSNLMNDDVYRNPQKVSIIIFGQISDWGEPLRIWELAIMRSWDRCSWAYCCLNILVWWKLAQNRFLEFYVR